MAALPDQMQSNQLPEYDALRRRLKGQFQQKAQESQDALQRRYAANGMIGSGAYGKEQQLQTDQSTRDEVDATAQLDFAQANELQRRKEMAEGRAYQTSEREATQGFAKGEREAGQGFARGEREAGQIFSKDLFDRDMQFKQTAQGLDEIFRNKEFAESVKANKFNAEQAAYEAGAETGGAYDKFLYKTYGPNFRNR